MPHAVVELARLKVRGWRSPKRCFVKNVDEVREAYLTAAEVEIGLARGIGDYDDIQDRLQVFGSWIEAPVLTPDPERAHDQLASG